MTSIYSRTSPYHTTNLSNGFLDIIDFRDIPPLSNDILYEVPAKYNNRPDLLAYDLYGDANLWWVFAVRNKSILRDPTFDLVPGVKIYLPQLTTINTSLGL